LQQILVFGQTGVVESVVNGLDFHRFLLFGGGNCGSGLNLADGGGWLYFCLLVLVFCAGVLADGSIPEIQHAFFDEVVLLLHLGLLLDGVYLSLALGVFVHLLVFLLQFLTCNFHFLLLSHFGIGLHSSLDFNVFVFALYFFGSGSNHVEHAESIFKHRLFDVQVQTAVGVETRGVVNFYQLGLQLVVDQNVESKYFETHVAREVIRLAGFILVLQGGLH